MGGDQTVALEEYIEEYPLMNCSGSSDGVFERGPHRSLLFRVKLEPDVGEGGRGIVFTSRPINNVAMITKKIGYALVRCPGKMDSVVVLNRDPSSITSGHIFFGCCRIAGANVSLRERSN